MKNDSHFKIVFNNAERIIKNMFKKLKKDKYKVLNNLNKWLKKKNNYDVIKLMKKLY